MVMVVVAVAVKIERMLGVIRQGVFVIGRGRIFITGRDEIFVVKRERVVGGGRELKTNAVK